jgi:hypothetical protein
VFIVKSSAIIVKPSTKSLGGSTLTVTTSPVAYSILPELGTDEPSLLRVSVFRASFEVSIAFYQIL